MRQCHGSQRAGALSPLFFWNFALLVHEGRQRGLDYGFPASMKAPRNAPPFGAGVPSASWRSLGARYYMGNTKIATMFASHGASGKRRWGCAGQLDELERWLLFGCK